MSSSSFPLLKAEQKRKSLLPRRIQLSFQSCCSLRQANVRALLWMVYCFSALLTPLSGTPLFPLKSLCGSGTSIDLTSGYGKIRVRLVLLFCLFFPHKTPYHPANQSFKGPKPNPLAAHHHFLEMSLTTLTSRTLIGGEENLFFMDLPSYHTCQDQPLLSEPLPLISITFLGKGATHPSIINSPFWRALQLPLETSVQPIPPLL